MDVPLTIGDFLDRAALVHRDRVAVVDEPYVAGSLGLVSYRELEARAWGMALALERLGLDHGDRVAIVSPNSARFLVSFYGVSAYGRVLVPVNYRLSPDEVQYIVEHSGASVLLVDPELEDALGAACARRSASCSTGAPTPSCSPRPRPTRSPGPGAPPRATSSASTTRAGRPPVRRVSSSPTATAG